MGLSIISPMGRALQSSIQNLPPDQALAKLTQNMGQVPLSELLSMKMQLDRMKQASASMQAQYPTSTVADDMKSQLTQGVASAPMQREMFSPESFAGGGIVALAGGGSPASRAVDSRLFRAEMANYTPGINAGANNVGFMTAAEYEAEIAKAAKAGNFARVQQLRAGMSNLGNMPVGQAARSVGKGIGSLTRGTGAIGRALIGGTLGATGLAASGVEEAFDPVSTEAMADYFRFSPYIESSLPPDTYKKGMTREEMMAQDQWRQGRMQKENIQEAIKQGGIRALGTIPRVVTFGAIGPDEENEAAVQQRQAAAPGAAARTADPLPAAPAEYADPMAGISGLLGYTPRPDLYTRGLLEEIRGDLANKPSRDDEQARINKMFEEQGIGKADRERMKQLAERGEDDKKNYKEDRRMALAAAGFRMAEAASRPGATLLGSAAEGGTEAAKGMKEANAERRKALRELQDAEYAVGQNIEKVNLGKMAMSDDAFNKAVERYEKARNSVAQLSLGYDNAQVQMRGDEMRANASRAGLQSAMTDPTRQAGLQANAEYNRWRKALAEGDPKASMYEKSYREAVKNYETVASGRSAGSNRTDVIERQLRVLGEQLKTLTPGTEAYRNLEQQMNALVQSAMGESQGGPNVGLEGFRVIGPKK